jgi:uncharacterized membrane protein
MYANRDWSLSVDPVWPGSYSLLGIILPALAAVTLIGLTIWTYAGVQPLRSWRVRLVLAFRLAALACAFLMAVRPAITVTDELQSATTLLFLVDNSESMSLQDEFDNQSRWSYLQRLLEDSKDTLEELRQKYRINIVTYRFAEELAEDAGVAKPDGKRTDFGQALRGILERHGHDRNLRGLIVLSDGADNGTRYPALAEATPFRTLPCPIYAFGFGKPVTAEKQRDIAVTAINPVPAPVPVKGKLTVKGTIDAEGFENAQVNVRLLLDDKEVHTQTTALPKARGNAITMETDAPAVPGEVKVTVKVDPLPGEISTANNEMTTYTTVTKEGISVLLIDRPRFPEPQRIIDALAEDPRIRVYVVWLHGDKPQAGDLFDFGKQHYDAIILGDISASQLRTAGADMHKIRTLVGTGGTGLLMMGGYQTFANSDWQRTDIADVLPVELNAPGQSEQEWRLQPTEAGLAHYIMRQEDQLEANRAFWDKLPRLSGWTHLGAPKPGATVLAVRDGTEQQPMLVSQQFGQGRALAFAGDTTWLWEKYGQPDSSVGVDAHARFWKQIVFWLAKRDQAEGAAWVKPDSRRVPAGGKLGFTIGLRGRGGVDAAKAIFDVKVIGPKNVTTQVPTSPESGGERGTFWKTDVPGEYQIKVSGSGTDTEGKSIERTEASARFIVYQDDAELLHRAADYDFLQKLANAGGGKFMKAEELPKFLRELPSRPLPQAKPKGELWPDWRTPATTPFQAAFLLAFIGFLSAEWVCRRWWGWV